MARPLESNIPRLLPDNRLWLRPSAPQFLRGRQSCLDLLFDLPRLWDENETHREKTAHAADSEDRRGANKQLKADLTPLFKVMPGPRRSRRRSEKVKKIDIPGGHRYQNHCCAGSACNLMPSAPTTLRIVSKSGLRSPESAL